MQKVDCSNQDSDFKWSTLSFQGKSWTCFSSSASQGGLKRTAYPSISSEWLFSVVVHLCRLLLFSPLYHGLTLHIQNMFPCHFVHFLHTSAETSHQQVCKVSGWAHLQELFIVLLKITWNWTNLYTQYASMDVTYRNMSGLFMNFRCRFLLR
jgi:hypothetical protein